jgi:hypothetical protein
MGTAARTLVASLAFAATLVTAAPALAAPPPGPATFGVTTTTSPEPEPAPQPAADDLMAEPDAPAAPTVSLGAAAIQEGDDLQLTGIIFEGSISAPCPAPVTLTYDIVGWNPNPAGDDDFVAKHDAQVVLAPGQTAFSIGTLITGDDVPEPDEGLLATIHTVEGCAEMPAGQVGAKGTILDDDVQLVSIDDVEVLEGDAGTTDLVFTVSLDGPALIDYSVSLGWGPGTATPDVDFVKDAPPALFFFVGDESQTVTIQVNGDLEVEGDEFLSLSLYDTSFGLEVADSTGIGTILDDDEVAMPGNDGDEDQPDEGDPEDEAPEDGDDHDGQTPEVLDTATERSALPRTGVTVGVLALLGVALVAAGRAVVALTR